MRVYYPLKLRIVELSLYTRYFRNANVDLSMIEMNRILMENNHMLIVTSKKLKKKSKYRVVPKFCNKLKCEYLPINRRQIDKIYMECI